jgi:hypothetical protein
MVLICTRTHATSLPVLPCLHNEPVDGTNLLTRLLMVHLRSLEDLMGTDWLASKVPSVSIILRFGKPHALIEAKAFKTFISVYSLFQVND